MRVTEMNALTDQDLASLHMKFVVPVVVRDMLSGIEPLDDVAEYTLEEILSELHPDTAVLCLALCAQHIATHTGHTVAGSALKSEAAKIVDEYGPVWLAHEAGYPFVNDKAVQNLLIHIPEDLEALGDLLLATQAELGEQDAIAAILCDILGVQAHIHKDMSEAHIETLPLAAPEADSANAPSGASNVIPFPLNREPR